VDKAAVVSETHCNVSKEARNYNSETEDRSGSDSVCWIDSVKNSLLNNGLSATAVDLVLGSIRKSSQKQYGSYINRFLLFIQNRSIILENVTQGNVINFLESLYTTGLGYSSINTAASSIKFLLELMDIKINFLLVEKFKKGVYNERPALPRYKDTWDPQILFTYFKANVAKEVSIQYFSAKCAALLALSSCERVSALVSINYNDISIESDKCTIQLNSLQKQSRPGKHKTHISLQRFSDQLLCTIHNLEEYLARTKQIRKDDLKITKLFITTVRPYKNASKDTVARWIKDAIHKAGVPEHFTAHSTRSAATSNMHRKGMDIGDILKHVGWSSADVFHKFYNKAFHS
jgi:site-specific recombinase XerD